MTAPIRYLTVADVVAIHEYVLERGGYPPAPLVNQATLESALARAQNAAAYEDADIIRQVATLTVGIAQAQAFLDGNKRVAYEVLRAFLRLNGYRYVEKPMELADQLIDIAERRRDSAITIRAAVSDFEAWLRPRTAKDYLSQ